MLYFSFGCWILDQLITRKSCARGKPIVVRCETGKNTGRLAVFRHDDLFVSRFRQILGKMVSEIGKCYLPHDGSPYLASHSAA